MADALKIPITDAVIEETDFPWAIHFGGGDALAIQSEARGVGYTVYKAGDLGLGAVTRGMVAPEAHVGTGVGYTVYRASDLGLGAVTRGMVAPEAHVGTGVRYTVYRASDLGLATIAFGVTAAETDVATYLVGQHTALVTAPVISPSIVVSPQTQVRTYGNVDVGIERTDATGQLVTDSAAAKRIRRLKDALGLTSSDVARMIGAADDVVDEIESGRATLSARCDAKVADASRALDRLLAIFRRDRLPSVIRRPARAFGGQTPLDWILDGRIEEVAQRYDYGLAYQS